MIKTFDEELRVLFEQLLKLADKEEQAITADNLGELEACMRRKEEIFNKLRKIESKKGESGSSGVSEDVARLLVQVAERHERVSEKIRIMLGDCQKAIMEIRNGRKAHRAYQQARSRRREGSARLL